MYDTDSSKGRHWCYHDPKRGVICRWKQRVLSFHKATCETNFPIPRGLRIPSHLSPSPFFSSLFTHFTHTNTNARMRTFVSCFPCRRMQKHNCYRIAISLTALNYNIKLLYLLAQNIAMTLYKWLLQKNLLVGDVLICILCKKNLSGWVNF